MIDKQSEDYKLGYEWHEEGVKYNDPRMVNSNHLSGFSDRERQTRCGYSDCHWSKMGGYKTSSDLRTLFT